MSPIVRHFITHKAAENLEDCQDSLFAVLEKGAFAVADGAGNSFFPREWACCLTEHFVRNPATASSRDGFTLWLRDAHEDWVARVERVAEENRTFLVINGIQGRKPAAAAFVGVHLGEPADGQIPWKAIALGDSCLFHARAGGLVNKYPLTKSVEFRFDLHALHSYPNKHPVTPQFFDSEREEHHAPIKEGDVLLLASDALSRWLIRREEIERPVWGHLLSLATDEDFVQFVNQARSEATEPMQMDDVALIAVRFGEPHAVYCQQRFVSLPAAPILSREPAPVRLPHPIPVRNRIPADGRKGRSNSQETSELASARRRSGIARHYRWIALGFLIILSSAVNLIFGRLEIARLEEQLSFNRDLLDEIAEQNHRAAYTASELEHLRSNWDQLRVFVAKQGAITKAVLAKMDALKKAPPERVSRSDTNALNYPSSTNLKPTTGVKEQTQNRIVVTNPPTSAAAAPR